MIVSEERWTLPVFNVRTTHLVRLGIFHLELGKNILFGFGNDFGPKFQRSRALDILARLHGFRLVLVVTVHIYSKPHFCQYLSGLNTDLLTKQPWETENSFHCTQLKNYHPLIEGVVGWCNGPG